MKSLHKVLHRTDMFSTLQQMTRKGSVSTVFLSVVLSPITGWGQPRDFHGNTSAFLTEEHPSFTV